MYRTRLAGLTPSERVYRKELERKPTKELAKHWKDLQSIAVPYAGDMQFLRAYNIAEMEYAYRIGIIETSLSNEQIFMRKNEILKTFMGKYLKLHRLYFVASQDKRMSIRYLDKLISIGIYKK